MKGCERIEGGVRRSVYGRDASLVFSHIHQKNLREQRRGKEICTSGLFLSTFFLRACLQTLRKDVMTGGNKVSEWVKENNKQQHWSNVKVSGKSSFPLDNLVFSDDGPCWRCVTDKIVSHHLKNMTVCVIYWTHRSETATKLLVTQEAGERVFCSKKSFPLYNFIQTLEAKRQLWFRKFNNRQCRPVAKWSLFVRNFGKRSWKVC